MFSCKLASLNSQNDVAEYVVTTDESILDLSNNIISADTKLGRKLYDMVNSEVKSFIWKGVRYKIFDVIRYRSYSEMMGYRSTEGKKIAEIIMINKVKYLIHFTRIENLNSILEHGILSVQELDSMKIPYINNDFSRYDSRTDCSCFSIEFPNDSLLSSFQKRQTDSSWIIFLIDVSILIAIDIEKQFCIHNAASKGISQKVKYNQLQTAEDFQRMFSNHIEFKKNNGEFHIERKIDKRYLTTSNQAEILIKGIINRDYINGIITRNQEDKLIVDEIVRKFGLEETIESILEPRYFMARSKVRFKER